MVDALVGSLSRERLTPRLTGEIFLPERYHVHAVLDSTNREAADLARGGAPEGTVVVADRQTRGRGRRGRVWVSPPGENLYVSLVLRPPVPARRASQLTLVAGLALVESLVAAGVAAARLKWPNDVLVEGRKLAGILAEMGADGERIRFVTLGVGVNVNGSAAAFPPGVAERAVTLADLLHEPRERGGVLVGFLTAFEGWYRRYLREGFSPVRSGWLFYARLEGARVRVEHPGGGELVGEALDLDGEGCLLVRGADGRVERVMAGEVALL